MLGKTQQGKKEVMATSQAERKAKAILDTGMQAIKETSSMKWNVGLKLDLNGEER